MASSNKATAAVIVGAGKALEVRTVSFPQLEPDGMLVEVAAATLCGTDVGVWRSAGEEPFIPGHETCGRVVAIDGDRFAVTGEPIEVGDRIIFAYNFCGQCYYCTVANQPTQCPHALRFGREPLEKFPYLDGGCATHQYVPPRSAVIKVPDGVSNELAAASSCALRTVMHGFERLGRVASHEVAVVQGCGPVGLFALAVAVDRGFRRVLTIGAPASRLEVAKDWGADEVCNLEEIPAPAERKQWVLDRTQGRGADVVIQCATGGQAIVEGLDFVRPGGRYLSIGGGNESLQVPAGALTGGRMLEIIGVRSGLGRHFYEGLQFLDAARYPFDQLISGRYDLTNITEAYEAMAAYREVKPAIIPAAE